MSIQIRKGMMNTSALLTVIDNFDFKAVVRSLPDDHPKGHTEIFTVNFETETIEHVKNEGKGYDFFKAPVYACGSIQDLQRIDDGSGYFNTFIRHELKLFVKRYTQSILEGKPFSDHQPFNPYHFDPKVAMDYILFSPSQYVVYHSTVEGHPLHETQNLFHTGGDIDQSKLSVDELESATIIQFLMDHKSLISERIEAYGKGSDDRPFLTPDPLTVSIRLGRLASLCLKQDTPEALDVVKEVMMFQSNGIETFKHFLTDCLQILTEEDLKSLIDRFDFSYSERKQLLYTTSRIIWSYYEKTSGPGGRGDKTYKTPPYYRLLHQLIKKDDRVARQLSVANLGITGIIPDPDKHPLYCQGIWDDIVITLGQTTQPSDFQTLDAAIRLMLQNSRGLPRNVYLSKDLADAIQTYAQSDYFPQTEEEQYRKYRSHNVDELFTTRVFPYSIEDFDGFIF